ncbi:lysine exporter LysO family protein [Methanocella conradii]|uniref:lysine exporter LysO family protein n=1 Tax=Methanocella conradii TaxID=1175444 RepID=UPI0024B3AF4F|nr:lysine exporter LysO family protein [Methanocella conradii]MDI6896576.1 lysine exporter LysO family protein [Methanocella conradii]
MTSIALVILSALAIGIVAGVLGLAPGPSSLDTLIMAMLCLLLFVIGLDMSQNRSVVAQIKKLGWKMLLLPLFIAAGSILGALSVSFFIGMDPRYAMAIGAGFGWYSLSGVMLTSLVGAQIGTMALLSNVFREMLSIVIMPLVVRLFGRLAAIAPGGATTMDTTLPVVVRYAGSEMSVISFVSGFILSILVIFLVPFFATL